MRPAKVRGYSRSRCSSWPTLPYPAKLATARFRKELLEVEYCGVNISQLLDMSVG